MKYIFKTVDILPNSNSDKHNYSSQHFLLIIFSVDSKINISSEGYDTINFASNRNYTIPGNNY